MCVCVCVDIRMYVFILRVVCVCRKVQKVHSDKGVLFGSSSFSLLSLRLSPISSFLFGGGFFQPKLA